MTDVIIPKPIKILVVENSQTSKNANIRMALNQANVGQFKMRWAERLNKALLLLIQEDFDLVLLDLSLPDSRGLDTFIKVNEHTINTPVVVMSEEEDKSLALKVIREGAQDHVVKGDLNKENLQRTLLYAIERHRYRAMLQNLSLRDDLTGLLNRRGFLSLASQHLKIAQRSKWQLMLLFADLDGLKQINDKFGHPEGDEALRGVANILRTTFRASDIVARLGGDEFIVLALKVTDEGIKAISNRLRENVRQYNDQNQRYQISLSFGIKKFDPQNYLSLEEMIAQADKALYEDKQRKRGQ